MKYIRPTTIAGSVLNTTNIVETPPAAYNAGTTYAVGDQVSVLTGTTAALYKSLQAGNIGHTPASSPTYWQANGTAYAVYSAATLYALGDMVTDTTGHRLYESLSGGTAATVTMTIAVPCVVTSAAHGLTAGTPVTFTTTGALPTGLVVGTVYYVLAPAADTYNLAATVGGAAITTTGSQSGIHTATANPNLNKTPVAGANPTFWLDSAPSNTWAMFDQLNGTATTHPVEIDVTLAMPAGHVDSVALLGIDAATAQVIMTDATDGEVYNTTHDLTSTVGIVDAWSYCFEDIVRKDTLIVEDMPPYSAATIRIVIAGGGTAVSCGSMVVGQIKLTGSTVYGATVGIIDYSRKAVDAFGNYTITQRAFSKTGEFKVAVSGVKVDDIQRSLAQYRATPIVYIGTGDYSSTHIFGFYRSFGISIDHYDTSYLSIQIEGVT